MLIKKKVQTKPKVISLWGGELLFVAGMLADAECASLASTVIPRLTSDPANEFFG